MTIPGLLQTDDYARGFFGELGEDQQDWLTVRRARRALLDEPPGHHADRHRGHAAVGRRGAAVIGAQIDHLLAVSRGVAIRLGVVSPAAAVDFLAMGSFDVYENGVGTTVVAGDIGDVEVYSDPDEFAAFLRVPERIEQVAVWGDEARAEIQRIGEVYR